MNRALIRNLALVCFLACLCGCMLFNDSGQQVGQAEIKEFETRSVDAPFEKVYTAATGALFDLGYTIMHSDKQSGVLVGEKRQRNGESSMIFMPGAPPTRRPESELYDFLELTFLVQPAGKHKTDVRIKTDVNKERKLDAKAINEAWLYVQRQVMMNEGPSQSATPVARKKSGKKHAH